LTPDTSFLPHTETLSLHMAWGVWAGTTHRERAKALRSMGSPEAAAEKLEAELPSRIDRRVRAWKTNPQSVKLADRIEPLVRRRSELSA
jgi:hypothetical protein